MRWRSRSPRHNSSYRKVRCPSCCRFRRHHPLVRHCPQQHHNKKTKNKASTPLQKYRKEAQREHERCNNGTSSERLLRSGSRPDSVSAHSGGGTESGRRNRRGAGARVVCHQSGGSVCGGGGDVLCGQDPWCRLPPWPLFIQFSGAGVMLLCCFLKGRWRKRWALLLRLCPSN